MNCRLLSVLIKTNPCGASLALPTPLSPRPPTILSPDRPCHSHFQLCMPDLPSILPRATSRAFSLFLALSRPSPRGQTTSGVFPAKKTLAFAHAHCARAAGAARRASVRSGGFWEGTPGKKSRMGNGAGSQKSLVLINCGKKSPGVCFRRLCGVP